MIFAFSSFDTGQPAFALPASSSNFAWSAPGIFAFNVRCTDGDGKPVALLFQRDVGLGFHLLGGELGFAQDQRQRHGEAGGMRGADQFFRVGAGLAFEAAGEAVGVIVQRAALGRDRALAVLDAALPFGDPDVVVIRCSCYVASSVD